MSVYDLTVDMLSELSDEDLLAVNGIVKRFVVKDQQKNASFFKKMTKDEMLEKLAKGRKQIAEGKCETSEVMEKELAEEFGF